MTKKNRAEITVGTPTIHGGDIVIDFMMKNRDGDDALSGEIVIPFGNVSDYDLHFTGTVIQALIDNRKLSLK